MTGNIDGNGSNKGTGKARLILQAADGYKNEEVWSIGYFKDQFFLDLARAEQDIKLVSDNGVTGKVIHYRKYYRQAISKMYRIPLTHQNPKSEKEAVIFKISFRDLSSKTKEEFREYCKLYEKREITLLLKEVVIRLFENLDFDYAHISVMKKLRVRIDP